MRKWDKSTDATLIVKTQSRDQTHLPSDVVVADVLISVVFLLQQIIV